MVLPPSSQAGEDMPAAAHQPPADMHVDRVPGHKALGDLGVGLVVGLAERRQRLVGKYHAPAIGCAGRVALEDGDLPIGVILFQQQRRIQRRLAAVAVPETQIFQRREYRFYARLMAKIEQVLLPYFTLTLQRFAQPAHFALFCPAKPGQQTQQ